MSKLMTLWTYVRQHKYLITIVLFLVVIVFLDENSLIQRVKQRQEIEALNNEINKYKEQNARDSIMLEDLKTNPEALEKIAREKYRMKKPNEDIFIFE